MLLGIFRVKYIKYKTKSAKENELSLILPKKDFYHIYAIGTEECMRSILASFFYADKTSFEEQIQ